ncbi:MAG: IPT/TIG domain-containing protein [Chitinophagaceae bacterium]
MKKIFFVFFLTAFYAANAQTPAITSFSPAQGKAGSIIVVYGNNLMGASAITVGGIPVSNFWPYFNSSAYYVVLPSGPASGPVTVEITTPTGVASKPGLQFYNTYIPVITSVSPANPNAGDPVTIKGINFNDVVKVGFNSFIASTTFSLVDSNTITTVYTGDPYTFAYVASPIDSSFYFPGYAPTISGFSPTSGTSGTRVTITGTNLSNINTVYFGKTLATTVTKINANTLEAVVGQGESGNVVVSEPVRGAAASAPGFNYANPTPPAVTPSGSNPVAGNITQTVTQDAVVQTYNGSPYLQRHYDIEPDNNAASATATITLYYLQEDFDNFNSQPAHGLNLPTGPTDNANKANLRIFQYHGASLYGTPGTYSGGSVITIDPDDNNINWNSSTNSWEVSFNVNGFSGFFAASASSALPVTLLSFTGRPGNNTAILEWKTVAETGFDHFELEQGEDGNKFHRIAVLATADTMQGNEKAYSYTDKNPAREKSYYRLKMVDLDGHYEYSKIIAVQTNAGLTAALFTYPNPAAGVVTVNYPRKSIPAALQLTDMSGRMIKTLQLAAGSNQIQLFMPQLPAGNYLLTWSDGKQTLQQKIVVQ